MAVVIDEEKVAEALSSESSSEFEYVDAGDDDGDEEDNNDEDNDNDIVNDDVDDSVDGGDNVDGDDIDIGNVDNVDGADESIDRDGVIIEYEVVVESYCELSVFCPLDKLSMEDDTKVYVEDPEKEEYILSSKVELEEW